jgi:hypothetical protein
MDEGDTRSSCIGGTPSTSIKGAVGAIVVLACLIIQISFLRPPKNEMKEDKEVFG